MDSVRFWDKMSAGYDRQAAGKYKQSYADTVALTRKYLKPTDAVLDFACGTGLTTVQVADAVASIHAIDISPKMISLAQSKCAEQGHENVTFTVTTLFDARLAEGSFDAVLAFNILHGLPNAVGYCRRIHRLLKPGGLFISVTDCLKQSPPLTIAMIRSLCFLRVLPYIKLLTDETLKAMISDAGFRLLHTQNLFGMPPNLFVAAQKD